MKTPHLPKLHISKKAVLIAAGVILVVGVTSYGMVRQVQADKQAQAATAKQEATRKAVLTSLNQQVVDLQASNKAEAAKTSAVCSYIRTVAAKNKTISVPVACTSVI